MDMGKRPSPLLLAPIAVLSVICGLWWLSQGKDGVGEAKSARLTPSPKKAQPQRNKRGASPRQEAVEARSKTPKAHDEARRRQLDEKRRQIRAALAARKHETPQSETTTGLRAPQGELGKEHIQEVFRELVPVIRDCYNSELVEDENFSAHIVTKFTILGDEDVGGLVDEVSFDEEESVFSSEDTAAKTRFTECITQSMYVMEFDPPEGGGMVEVSYPVTFAPG